MTVIDWLLDSDPVLRWQVMRDLTHEPADVVATERSRVATEGWSARLLASATVISPGWCPVSRSCPASRP
jgi:hypothetical protein